MPSSDIMRFSRQLLQKSSQTCEHLTQWATKSCSHWRTLHHSSRLPFLNINDEVRTSLEERRPVVALESTIITHGMPWPQNLQTALEVQNIIRENGAIPATVAIIKGQIQVGLSASQLDWLASDQSQAIKTSRRDMSYVLSQHLTGGTTVSATMVAAHMAGIQIFVTGGIGGVHRDAEKTMDVSADLRELGRTPVTVISSGVKSILDIPKTLEFLETEGVGVFVYGPTTDFPAFFTPSSGSHAPYNIETPSQAAQVIDASQQLGLSTGTLITVPVPGGEAVDAVSLEGAIQDAVLEAKSQMVSGKEVTPFLLKRVNDLMGGVTLRANIALIKNNAKVGSEIAVALSQINKGLQDQNPGSSSEQRGSKMMSSSTTTVADKRDCRSKESRVVVVGGTNVDLTARFGEDSVVANGATYRGSVGLSFGGVGRNIADALSRLDHNPRFLSLMGDDDYKRMLQVDCPHMDLTAVKCVPGHKSATYCAIMNCDGDLIYGIGDFDVHQEIDQSYVSDFEENIIRAPLVFFDGNIPAETMSYITDICHTHSVPVFFEPTDVRLVKKLFETNAWRHVTMTSPNLNELRMMHAGMTSAKLTPPNSSSSVEQSEEDTLEEVLSLAKSVVDHIPHVLVTIGRHGIVLCSNSDVRVPLPYHSNLRKVGTTMSAVHMPILKDGNSDIVSVSGAGDCLVASFVTALLQNKRPVTCLAHGILGATASLSSHRAVPNSLNVETISLNKRHLEENSRVLICS